MSAGESRQATHTGGGGGEAGGGEASDEEASSGSGACAGSDSEATFSYGCCRRASWARPAVDASAHRVTAVSVECCFDVGAVMVVMP